MRVVGLLSVLIIAVGGWLWKDMQVSLTQPMQVEARGSRFEVRPGMTVRDIATELAGKGILSQPLYLELEARRQGVTTRVQAGEYLLTRGTTPIDFLDKIVRGEVIHYSITLVEGWDFNRVMRAIAANERLVHTLTDLSPQQVMARIGHAGIHPEGRFLPDTYRFTRGTTDAQILKRAFRMMEQTLARAWAGCDADLPYQTPDDALILASIIEKETGRPEERAAISGVFLRRIKEGMKLQTDPTVIYALGEAFDGDLKRDHLKVDNPYNTYRYAGLPPTPIAMPGTAAIQAACHPADGDALYFVAKGDGSHYFSATLEEHNQAVAKYQLGRALSDGKQ